MKICISYLALGNNVFGGIENSLYNLALGFSAHGVEVTAYSSYTSGTETHMGSIPIFRSAILPREISKDHSSIYDSLVKNSQQIKSEFCGLLRNEKVDCVIAADALWGIAQVVGIWECAPCPIVLSLHVLNTPELLKQAGEVPYLFRRVVSNTLKHEIECVQVLNDLIVIPNSIDVSRFRPINNLRRDSKVIFCNARLDPIKGVIYLIQAFAKFCHDLPGYELWLCTGDFLFGDRSGARTELQSEITRLGIGNRVKYLPDLLWSQIPEVICQSFAVVLPTLYESFGRAAIETLACGVPLIASRVGNLPELVDDAAILVEPRSPESIYESLILLHNNPEYYQYLAGAGPCIAAKYDNRIIASKFLDIIRGRLGFAKPI